MCIYKNTRVKVAGTVCIMFPFILHVLKHLLRVDIKFSMCLTKHHTMYQVQSNHTGNRWE